MQKPLLSPIGLPREIPCFLTDNRESGKVLTQAKLKLAAIPMATPEDK